MNGAWDPAYLRNVIVEGAEIFVALDAIYYIKGLAIYALFENVMEL